MDNCLIFILNVFCFNGFVENPHCTNKKTSAIPSKYYLYLSSSTPNRFGRLFALCSKRECLLGLDSCLRVKAAEREQAQLDSVVCFLNTGIKWILQHMVWCLWSVWEYLTHSESQQELLKTAACVALNEILQRSCCYTMYGSCHAS